MVTERARTLPTEPIGGEIAKSNPLNFIHKYRQRVRTCGMGSRVGFGDNNTLVLRTRVLLSPKPTLDPIPHGKHLQRGL